MRGSFWRDEQRNAYVVQTLPWWPVLVLAAALATGRLAGASFWVGRGAVGCWWGCLVGLRGGGHPWASAPLAAGVGDGCWRWPLPPPLPLSLSLPLPRLPPLPPPLAPLWCNSGDDGPFGADRTTPPPPGVLAAATPQPPPPTPTTGGGSGGGGSGGGGSGGCGGWWWCTHPPPPGGHAVTVKEEGAPGG